MKKYLLAAVAIAAVAAPAYARDGSPYLGVEGGVLLPKDANVDRRGPLVASDNWVDWLDIDQKVGFDVDLIGGYDFGLIRLEGELGYKRAGHSEYNIDDQAPGPFPAGVTPGASIDADGNLIVSEWSQFGRVLKFALAK